MSKEQGYKDALRGHTACPYGVPSQVKEWNKGYDKAEKEGKAQLPRFSKLKRKRR